MIKAIGMLGSLYGDLIMCSAVIKQFKLQYPDSHFTFACAKPFASILPLFFNNQYIDSFHVWDGYNNWPTDKDKEFINNGKFNIVFNALAPHPKEQDWYNHRHYIEEVALMLDLDKPKDLTCELVSWFGRDEKYSKYIAIGAFPSNSKDLTKTLSMDKWEAIIELIIKLGYEPIQLGGWREIQIKGTKKPELNWVEAAQILYSSKLVLTTDSVWSWLSSAYECSTVGFYCHNYPNMVKQFSHLPVNENATYLVGKKMDDIPLETILKVIEEKLK